MFKYIINPLCSNTGFVIESDKNIIEALQLFYPKEFFVKTEKENSIQINCCFSKKRIDVISNNHCLKKFECITIEAMEYVIKIINTIKIFQTTMGTCNYYHGALVRVNDKNIVLFGKSNAGKTTTCAFLSEQNNSHVYAEDVFIINTNEISAICWNRPFLLREDGYNILREKYGVFLADITKINYESYKRYMKINKNYQSNLSFEKIDYFFVLNRTQHETKPFLRETDETFKKILENSFFPNNGVKNVECALRLSKRVNVFDLYYNDLNELYDFLNSLT